MEQTRRDSFRSRWGFKLACIGSAVGMGLSLIHISEPTRRS